MPGNSYQQEISGELLRSIFGPRRQESKEACRPHLPWLWQTKVLNCPQSCPDRHRSNVLLTNLGFEAGSMSKVRFRLSAALRVGR